MARLPARALLALVAVLLMASLLVLRFYHPGGVSVQQAERAGSIGCRQAASAFRLRQSGVWLTLSGQVVRLLPDEYGRFQHQRFFLACPSGQTVLIVNDTSIGRRVPVRLGDAVVVRGQYVWNAQGGLVHFTHHAQGSAQGGWIEFAGKLFSLSAEATRQT
jgi:hypothetical protein